MVKAGLRVGNVSAILSYMVMDNGNRTSSKTSNVEASMQKV